MRGLLRGIGFRDSPHLEHSLARLAAATQHRRARASEEAMMRQPSMAMERSGRETGAR